MREDRIYPEGETPFVSTFEYHRDRERAPHLEQEYHRPRLELAAQMVRQTVATYPVEKCVTVSDLGCGDGGLLSLLAGDDRIQAWGYDFAPANQAGWQERGVEAQALDVFGADWNLVEIGDVAVMTEVLEHIAAPRGVLRRIRKCSPDFLVCSSPWNESAAMHDPSHAWAWDLEGYAAMLTSAGWEILRHEQVNTFQVVLAKAAPEVAE